VPLLDAQSTILLGPLLFVTDGWITSAPYSLE